MLDFDQRGRKREKKKKKKKRKEEKKRESREKGRDSGKETRGRIGRDREGVYGGGAKPVLFFAYICGRSYVTVHKQTKAT